MRILTITSHISSNALPCFKRNKTGFGYMVHDIVTALSQKADVDVLVYYYRFHLFILNGARYLGIAWIDIFRYLYLCISPSILFKMCRKYPIEMGAKARLFYCWLLTGYFRHIINKGRYDIVHIHGCSIINDLWINLCHKVGQKYVVTLHGLNSFSDSIQISCSEKQHEKDFLHDSVKGWHNITVIASGIKNKIMQYENVNNVKNITVVCNAFHLERVKTNYLDIRSLYNIPQMAKIVLYVGNISLNKNQRQMVSAFPLIRKDIRESTYVLFLGNHGMGIHDLRPIVSTSPYKDHLICCGGIDKSQMYDYYETASAVVLLSISEGFGLSLVEGMHFGVPCATFMDLDAYDDIYSPYAMIGIPNRSDNEVALAVEKLLSTTWNKDRIIEYSKKFGIETMANNYINTFYEIIKQ